ncbi:MAG: chorismate synthase [Clostridia bacterium]|nr:chorismate synthase [Clostridia bacterium]
MSSSTGENLRLTVFGQSHSPAVGMTLEGLPAGLALDMDKLAAFLARRAPGRDPLTTSRREDDVPEFLSGLSGGVTCGVPLTAVIRNGDTRPGDYALFEKIPRPGHADYTGAVKYRSFGDPSGGGHFSGRLTAPLCVAGGICLQLLEKEKIRVRARQFAVGGVFDDGSIDVLPEGRPTVSPVKEAAMRDAIEAARRDGDSVGGIIECAVYGLPAGLGDPIFGGMENRISSVVFGIPAVKGIEFGAGFACAGMRGSECNDAFALSDGRVVTSTNNCGGILGGITDGMPLVFRAAFKPTPSIAKPQNTLNLGTGEQTELKIPGRHDPCVVLRALPCVEAAAAFAVADALIGRRKEQ